jgi:peptidoglycan/xylan/chitin deacetylase (PgdA/CDA1 family)
MSKKILIITPIVLLLLIALAFGLFRISKSRTFQFFGEIIHRVETQEKVVALTFDDAPMEMTRETLRILAEKGVPATFYVIGEKYRRIS